MINAQKYLGLLDSKAEKFLFACYDYRKQKKGRQFYGTFNKVLPRLQECNEDVFCVYVTVNETVGPDRKKEHIKRARAIWVEDDNVHSSPRTDFPLKPSMIVESSPGKYHYYWLTSCTKLDDWNSVMMTMVKEWGCDKNARDISRVMRIPDFNHRKDLSTPHVCKLIDDNGHFYSWFQITKAFPKYVEPEPTATSEPNSSGYSESTAIRSLLTSENYHGSLVSISMSLSNIGVSRELQYMTLFGLMHKIPAPTRRPEWEARVSDEHLYECIDTAIKKITEENSTVNVEELKITENVIAKRDAIFPPGEAGDLCKEIMEMAPYENREIALSGGIGLIAGIIGRTYNVLGMGLNMYIAVLADSGIGKANLKDSINMALRAGGAFNIGQSFVGRSRFTGPKAIFDMLSQGLSRISVIEEAGLVQESKAGDNSGTTRCLLDLYTSSGFGKWAGDEGYSARENSIPALHSPALSVINVSTPRSFLMALKQKSADVSGEIARLWMMRSLGEKPYLNESRRFDFSDTVIKKLGYFVTKCAANQPVDSELKVVRVEVPPHIIKDANKWVDLENQYIREGDHLRRTMCSRAFAKIIKLAAIVSVYNGKLILGQEEYDWAVKEVKAELESIAYSFKYDISTELEDIVPIVSMAIIKTLKGAYLHKPQNTSPLLSQHGVFTFSTLNQILANNRHIIAINDPADRNNPKTGLEKVIQYMCRQGLLLKVEDDKLKQLKSKAKVAYRITNDFKIQFSEENSRG